MHVCICTCIYYRQDTTFAGKYVGFWFISFSSLCMCVDFVNWDCVPLFDVMCSSSMQEEEKVQVSSLMLRPLIHLELSFVQSTK